MPPTLELIEDRLRHARATLTKEPQAREEYRAACVEGIGTLNQHFEDTLQALCYVSEDKREILHAATLFEALSQALVGLVALPGDADAGVVDEVDFGLKPDAHE